MGRRPFSISERNEGAIPNRSANDRIVMPSSLCLDATKAPNSLKSLSTPTHFTVRLLVNNLRLQPSRVRGKQF